MKKLRIGRSHFVLIDNSDFERLSQYKWAMYQGYAAREMVVSVNPRVRKIIKMHREILGFPDFDIDHINRNKLDNRKLNLRKTNKSANGHNRGAQINSKTKIKGVCFDTRTNKWRAYLTINKKQVYSHLFKDQQQATLARQQAERVYYNVA